MRHCTLAGLALLGMTLITVAPPPEALASPSEAAASAASDEEANKELVRRYIDVVWNRKDYSRHGDFLSPDCILNGEPLGGIEGANRWVQYWHNIFPDQQKTFLKLLAEDNEVVAHFLEEGTHSAELFGTPATGKYFKYPVVAFFRIADGKIVEITAVGDQLHIYQDLVGQDKAP